MSFIAELRNVAKTFDGIVALDSINLQIREKEILALLGPNGSGKTTLLKILAFLEKPLKGEIFFRGKKATEKNMEQLRKESTMVFQKTILFNTTVYNNVAYGLNVRKLPKNKIHEEVKNALKLVKLEGFEKRQAKKLSGGEQQRVALARALVLNTKFLLLDEPTANLDPKNALLVEEIIENVNHESGATIIIATHNMFQAKRLPHRVALIMNGKISEIGTPAEIFGKLSKTLASFAAAENVFTGTAKITEEGTTLVDIGNGVIVEATLRNSGKISIFISPEDIILSKTRFASSARNIFTGKIVEILDLDSIVRLKVDVGKPFTVQITKRSFNDMGLNVNMDVYLAFKASSVQIV
ncbi:ABC transporter ATP-binding protein [Candidatus Bathyarchaeota archaeon]|nr:ABC transporter ATP-binding protein [Candidatus Bathyarchaeota archaeon]